jgi:hypothetical protein
MDRDRDVCAFVLDYLRDGPARLDDMIRDAQERHGFTRMDLGRATWRLNISPQKRSQDGADSQGGRSQSARDCSTAVSAYLGGGYAFGKGFYDQGWAHPVPSAALAATTIRERCSVVARILPLRSREMRATVQRFLATSFALRPSS